MTKDGNAFTSSFEIVVTPHLDAGYRLAVWLVGNEHDAEDAVQDAAFRAFRHIETFSGGNARAWFLRIVRNSCYDMLGRRRQPLDTLTDDTAAADPSPDPEALLLQIGNVELVRQVLADLSPALREVLALRELEELTYRELADLLEVPIGTVMSRLSRARDAFRRAMGRRLEAYAVPGR
jgi:RNA polymerase sigma-70 factor (ECF subfamily)